jgi:replication-associated recombination protein RarA
MKPHDPTFKASDQLSVGGYRVGDLISALQKAIRRGQVEDACFWASELSLSGCDGWCWKRLRLIASEDCSADSGVAVLVRALYENWLDFHKAKDEASRMFLMHAVVALCRAEKSRVVDHLLVVNFIGERSHPPIPDEALDIHTPRGRAMKRGLTHFYEVAAKLSNPDRISAEYPGLEERARQAMRQPGHWLAASEQLDLGDLG